LHSKQERNGWYLQQLLKLYSGRTIKGILEMYLVIDADTFFIKPVSFVDNLGRHLFGYGTEYHQPYFDHMKHLHPSLEKILSDKSGICHHMLFSNRYLDELFTLVEEYHGNNKKFWQIFLDFVCKKQCLRAGASEYEMYFNFVLKYHSEKILIRPLNYINSGKMEIPEQNSLYDYISFHWYMN
jgi:hypothetical protein